MNKSVEQHINAPVYGHVAGGNVTVSQTIIRPQLWQTKTAEEVLRDKVPKVCHGQLDQILNTADVTASDVLAAWRASALDCKDSNIVRQWTKLDYWFGGLLLALLLPYPLMLGAVIFWPNLPDAGKINALLLFGVMTVVISVLAIWVLKPQRTARRAMRALGR